jgi:hypothetical protein
MRLPRCLRCSRTARCACWARASARTSATGEIVFCSTPPLANVTMAVKLLRFVSCYRKSVFQTTSEEQPLMQRDSAVYTSPNTAELPMIYAHQRCCRAHMCCITVLTPPLRVRLRHLLSQAAARAVVAPGVQPRPRHTLQRVCAQGRRAALRGRQALHWQVCVTGWLLWDAGAL